MNDWELVDPPTLSWPGRLGLALVYLILMFLLVSGIILLWDYFHIEHGRTEPWKAFLALTADLSAFVWFQRFFWRHSIAGRPFIAPTWSDFQRSGGAWFIIGSGVMAIGIDALATFSLRWEDEQRFADRQLGIGQVERIRSTGGEYHRKWEIDGTLTTVDGRTAPFRFRIAGDVVKMAWRLREPLPAAIVPDLVAERPGFNIPIAYDPAWPARNWLDTPDWQAPNRGWAIGYMFLLIQLLGLVFTAVMVKDGYDRGELRSWWECPAIVPLFFQALVVAALGFAYAHDGVLNLS